MKKVFRFWKVLIVDILGVLFMIAAILTGWLPGPGGIPLFIIGLGLLASNHDWAQKYIDLLQEYADRLGDIVFIKNPRVQIGYDILAPLLVAGGGFLIWQHTRLWMLSAGVSACFLGITIFLGNRGRWGRLKQQLKRKR